jgi:uncharacterized cupredoxin-like copper-binding protein
MIKTIVGWPQRQSLLVTLLAALFTFFAPAGAEAQSKLKAQEAIEEYMDLDEMSFHPHRLTFRAGRLYRLILRNVGDKRHDLVAPSFFAAMDVQSFRGGDTQKSNIKQGRIVLRQGNNAEIVFRARQPGTYELWCSISGHREKGMEGEFVVTP